MKAYDYDLKVENKELIEVMSLDARIYKNKDIVPAKAYDRVRWERDIAIGQLKELGFGFGEKVEPVVRKSKIDKAISEMTEMVKESNKNNCFRSFTMASIYKDCIEILERNMGE